MYRAKIGLAYHWHQPGVTRVPVRGGKHWQQVEDVERYPLATSDLLIGTFFPTSTNRQRGDLLRKARQHLNRMIKEGDARLVKGASPTPEKPRQRRDIDGNTAP